MESMKIENHILKTELLDIDYLIPLQGDLKKLSGENFNKLRKSLIEKGFQFTVHVWEQGGTTYIIDGHQRVHVMKQLRKAGWEVPPITCAYVKAATYHDAKELILYSISQYGKVDKEGFDDFTLNEGFDFSNFDMPDFDLDLMNFFNPEDDSETNKIDGKTQSEKLENYLNSSIREIKLHFSNEEFPEIQDKFNSLRKEYGVDNNSEVVKILFGMQ